MDVFYSDIAQAKHNGLHTKFGSDALECVFFFAAKENNRQVIAKRLGFVWLGVMCVCVWCVARGCLLRYVSHMVGTLVWSHADHFLQEVNRRVYRTLCIVGTNIRFDCVVVACSHRYGRTSDTKTHAQNIKCTLKMVSNRHIDHAAICG